MDALGNRLELADSGMKLVPMRFRLRTLLIVLALGPPLIAALWFDWGYVLLAAVYFASLVLLFPAANYLSRNSP